MSYPIGPSNANIAPNNSGFTTSVYTENEHLIIIKHYLIITDDRETTFYHDLTPTLTGMII